MKRNKKVELSSNIEFGRLVLFIIFYSKKRFAITCSIPRSGKCACVSGGKK